MTTAVRILCASLTIAVAPAALAHADATDDDYVNALAAQGVTGEPSQLIATGHTVCSSATQPGLALPGSLTKFLPMGYVMSSLRLPAKQAQVVVNAAITAYCPQLINPPSGAPGSPPSGTPSSAPSSPPPSTGQLPAEVPPGAPGSPPISPSGPPGGPQS